MIGRSKPVTRPRLTFAQLAFPIPKARKRGPTRAAPSVQEENLRKNRTSRVFFLRRGAILTELGPTKLHSGARRPGESCSMRHKDEEQAGVEACSSRLPLSDSR